jgi:serine/threonine protein phosphatase PrpC
MDALNVTTIAWGAAARPLRGESSSGDAYFVRALHAGFLAAVVDGLGHGDEAADAARICVDTLGLHAHEPIELIVARCHERLLGTRGVTMSVALFDATNRRMSWMGVGNVEGLYVGAGRTHPSPLRALVQRNGVVGMRLPHLQASVVPLTPGDTVVLATDGIRDGFTDLVRAADPPQLVADGILAKFGKESDDALVLVVRYR